MPDACLFLIPEVTYSQVLISFPSSLSSRISFLWQIIGGMGMLLDGEKRRDGWIPGFEWFWNRMPLFSFSQKLVLQQLPCYTLRLVLTSLVSSSIFSWRFAFILLSKSLSILWIPHDRSLTARSLFPFHHHCLAIPVLPVLYLLSSTILFQDLFLFWFPFPLLSYKLIPFLYFPFWFTIHFSFSFSSFLFSFHY